jgi:hypothetical protein
MFILFLNQNAYFCDINTNIESQIMMNAELSAFFFL